MGFKQKIMFYHKKNTALLIKEAVKNSKGLKQKLIAVYNLINIKYS